MPSISDILIAGGLGAPSVQPGATSITGPLPWASGSNPNVGPPSPKAQPIVNSAFFQCISPKGELWDKLLPYRLLVIDTANGNKVVGGNKPSEITISPLGNGTLAFVPMTTAWEFLLPLTPAQLAITDTYAINTSATLRGILEEHSGVRFKNIAISGTFGVWPGRASIGVAPTTPGILQSVFAGTIASAQNVATQFQTIINAATTGSLASKPTTVRPGDPQDPENGLGTGYYQTVMFQQFIEQYTEAKKNPANASWRLVFDIPKQNQSFVVTPVAFTWNESVNRPMEINYNLQLKAWRRIDLQSTPTTSSLLNVTQLSPGILQQITNTISAAQNTAAAATNLIGSVRSDVDNILNIIRQTGLFVKQLAGIVVAASDLPAQLVGDTKSTISDFISTLDPTNLTGSAATDQTTLQSVSNIKQLNTVNEGLSSTAVASGQLGPNAIASANLNPSTAVFTNPLQYPLLFGQVPVSSLTLNTAQQNALQNELNTVSEFTVANLKTMRATIQTMTSQLASSFGAGSAYYSALFNLPPPVPRVEPMTIDEFDILQSFYELLQAYDVLTATNQLDNDQILNNMEYVNALAATSNIEFSIPNSKIQVPVPFGLNMEQIAERYLGDAQRWLEIATLNELREPYIDENGFEYPLLSNADGRSVIIGNNDDLFIGQTVFLYSNTQDATARKILKMVQLSQTSFLITLDGLANLSVFTTVDQAYLQAYLPGTVNSQNTIFVPSNLQTTVDDQINIPASVANVDLVGLSKVDWLLDMNGDIAVNNTGDFRLAAGITNLIQALNIKLGTQVNTCLLNPDFGLSVKPGTMNSDTSAAQIYNEIVKLITNDSRFSGISGLQVNLNGPQVLINLGVQLSGIQGVFPVSFQLPTTV